MTVYPSHTISVSIDRNLADVYGFVSEPENFPRWAAGLGSNFQQAGEEWSAADPDGHLIRIRFAPRNDFGVAGHTVSSNAGEILNAMRVIANGTGAEVIFTLLRRPQMSDEIFAADAAAIERDLKALKAMLEN